MRFICIKDYEGLNLLRQSVSIKAGTYLDTIDGYICYDGYPICRWNSELARRNFVWCDDGKEQFRIIFESVIVLSNREKMWTERVPEYKNDAIVGYKDMIRVARFSPNEVKYIRENFSNLICDDENSLMFNDHFYVGSDIKEIESLYEYLIR